MMSAATKTRACPTCGWNFGVMPQTYMRTGRPLTSKISFCPLSVDVIRCATRPLLSDCLFLNCSQSHGATRCGPGRHHDWRPTRCGFMALVLHGAWGRHLRRNPPATTAGNRSDQTGAPGRSWVEGGAPSPKGTCRARPGLGREEKHEGGCCAQSTHA